VTQHLIVLKPIYLDAVLRGEKTMECRLARRAAVPYRAVESGDVLWLKASLGRVLAWANVKEVLYFENLTPAKINDLRDRFNREILGSDDFWVSRRDCRYATMIRFGQIKTIEPFEPGFTLAGPWLVLRGRKERDLLFRTHLDAQID
jgi:ASC-1-like (ASCH) protein